MNPLIGSARADRSEAKEPCTRYPARPRRLTDSEHPHGPPCFSSEGAGPLEVVRSARQAENSCGKMSCGNSDAEKWRVSEQASSRHVAQVELQNSSKASMASRLDVKGHIK